MMKRFLPMLCAFAFMLPIAAYFVHGALAVSPSIRAAYDADSFTLNVTGTGFVPGRSYVIMLSDLTPSPIGFLSVVADANGTIAGTVSSGRLMGSYNVRVSPVGGGDAVTQALSVRDFEVVFMQQPRINPQTGARVPLILVIAFGLATIGAIALCYVFRTQQRENRMFRRSAMRQKRLNDLLR